MPTLTITTEEQEIILIALNNLQNVMIELDGLNAAKPEKIGTALKEIDILKQKIIS